MFRRQNYLELVFKDISTFDAQNPIIGSLFKEIDGGKKDGDSKLLKKASNITVILLKSRLNALKRDDDNNNNFPLPPPPPPAFFYLYCPFH